jgi:hypothetical protein
MNAHFVFHNWPHVDSQPLLLASCSIVMWMEGKVFSFSEELERKSNIGT